MERIVHRRRARPGSRCLSCYRRPVRASRRDARHEIHVRRDPPQPLQGPQARAAEVKSRLQPSRLSTAIIASEARGASRHLTIEGARASKRSVRLRGVATGGQGTKSRVPISEGPSESLSFVCPFTEDLAFIFSEFRTQLSQNSQRRPRLKLRRRVWLVCEKATLTRLGPQGRRARLTAPHCGCWLPP